MLDFYAGLECLKLKNKGKDAEENCLFDNFSPSILRINWQMAIALN
jgi:hypothetical protein